MHVDKALTIIRLWIERDAPASPALDRALMVASTGGDAADGKRAHAEVLRRLAEAARRAIPSTDVIATRAEAKLGLRAVAALERRADTLAGAEDDTGSCAA